MLIKLQLKKWIGLVEDEAALNRLELTFYCLSTLKNGMMKKYEKNIQIDNRNEKL